MVSIIAYKIYWFIQIDTQRIGKNSAPSADSYSYKCYTLQHIYEAQECDQHKHKRQCRKRYIFYTRPVCVWIFFFTFVVIGGSILCIWECRYVFFFIKYFINCMLCCCGSVSVCMMSLCKETAYAWTGYYCCWPVPTI